jgi:hypothetical protein
VEAQPEYPFPLLQQPIFVLLGTQHHLSLDLVHGTGPALRQQAWWQIAKPLILEHAKGRMYQTLLIAPACRLMVGLILVLIIALIKPRVIMLVAHGSQL